MQHDIRLTRILRAIALASLVRAGSLSAQVVSGVVVMPDSATPVPGAIVVATNAQGTVVGRGLTSERGTFSIRLPAPGAYGLGLLRIGFRPSAGPTVMIGAGASEAVRIVFGAEAVRLAAVPVRERETCRVTADTGLVVARLWEEARKAMLTTQLGGEGAPLVAEWIEYDRMLDSAARLVREQHVRTSRNPTTHAFRSLSAELLANRGYVVDDTTGTMYYAPDAEVLLSETFAATHCFHLATARGAEAATLIGVGFQPTRERRARREIEGTLWLDRNSAELRTMEFRYVNLPDVADAAHPGGSVEFLRLADGRWLVSRWNLRMPQLRAPDPNTDGGARRVIMSATRQVLRGVQVTGGEVTRVERRDTVVYRATGARLAVQIVAADTLLRADGASVTLDGTDYTAIADRNGRVDLAPVLAGHYRARVHTSLMDSLGLPPVVREVAVRDDAHRDSIPLPGAREALSRACPRDSTRHGEGMLRGRVRDERASAMPQAAVVVTWQSNVRILGAADAPQLRYSEQTIGTLTDDTGGWKLCGVPRLTPLAVRVVSDSGSDHRTARLEDDQPFASVDLVVHRESAAIAREAEAALGKAARPRALVELSVTDLHAQPLADVTLDVEPPNGAKRTVVTGPSGRALLPDVAPGLLTVRARRVGFKPGRVAATIEPGRNTVPIMLSNIDGPTLDTVRVVGDRRRSIRHDEFETRRVNRQATASITRAEIERRNPASLWQMLTGIPSIKVVDIDTMVVALSTRSVALKPDLSIEPCFLLVMIDGTAMNSEQKGFDLRMLPPPNDVYGVEIFAGPSSIPLQYGGTGSGKWCGMVAIWTR
jgi:hypothetical protein